MQKGHSLFPPADRKEGAGFQSGIFLKLIDFRHFQWNVTEDIASLLQNGGDILSKWENTFTAYRLLV